MLCHYCCTIVHDVNIILHIIVEISLLLNGNLGMSYAKMKETIFYGLGWNYNGIDVEMTWRFGSIILYRVSVMAI